MANPNNPFGAFDPQGMFDPERIAAAMRGHDLGAVDMGAVVEAQRRNLEALAQANQVAADGMRALAERQAEILRQGMEQAASAMRELMSAGSPEDKAARQAEIAKGAFERAISNARELAEMTTRAQGEANEVIARRMAASMEEFKAMVGKSQGR
ncbi:MAG: phasin family protein [Alphaproteobacteria bacterium]|jgi:phasin family protein